MLILANSTCCFVKKSYMSLLMVIVEKLYCYVSIIMNSCGGLSHQIYNTYSTKYGYGKACIQIGRISCKMAEEGLKRVEEQLNCSICLDTYTDPKILQCFHVFCRQCLVPLGVRDQQGQLSLTCPTCRQATHIPARGVAGLQSAFHINNLLEILEDSARKLENAPATPERETPTDLNPGNKASHCFVHEDKELELYCETCGELICLKCVTKRGKHHSHDYEELNVAFEKYKKEITSSLEPMEKQVTIIKKALALIEQCRGEISDQRAALEDNIHVTFRRLREVLTLRETQLIGNLHKTTQGKLKGLAAMSDQIETTLAQLDSCLHFMRESIKAGNESNVLMMKTNTVHQVKELTTPFQADTLKSNTEADMVFSALADLTATCQNYGQVFSSGLLDPSKCHTTGKGLEVAVVGEKSTAILHAVSYEGKPFEEPIKSLECELVSEITGTRVSCNVERRGQSQYEISYQPTIKGRHQLHIKVEGQHVRGSPSSVAVKSPVEKLGTPILTLGGVRKPMGVAINERGEVVVTEWDRHCVSVFSPSGEKLRSFGTHGSGQGQFDCPCGIAVNSEGNILVTDFSNHRIQKFTAEGQFLAAVGTKGSGPLQFRFPTNIAFNTSNNKVYVVDNKNHRVHVLKSDLTFSSTFGKQGSGKGQFSYPNGIACDSTGKVYVADTGNHHIQVFTAEGKFSRMFGRHGQGRGELVRPQCVAVDTSGMVYVSEGGNHRVSVFTSDCQLVTSFGRMGEGPGEFSYARGLAVDNNGVVYVCDLSNNRVQVF